MQQPKAAGNVTFRVGPLVNLASLVSSLGCDPVHIFNQAGFDPGEFADPDHWMPYLRSSRLLARCVEATGCEHLGLLLGQRAEPSHLGLVGFLVRAAPRVEQALKALVEYIDLHDGAGSIGLNIGPEYSTLSFTLHLPGVDAVDQISDLSAVMMYNIMQMLCCPDWTASTVELIRKEPADRELYRRFFHAPIFFNSTETAITFNNHCLYQQPPAADVLLYKYLQQEAWCQHELHHHELVEELPEALVKGLLTDRFAARHIADIFGVRERTLHRRLKTAGTSFRKELDRARSSVSEQLLATTSLPVCDIATSLGYADSSGFIRAFQRWAGTSPSSWRKKHGQIVRNHL